MVSVRYRQHYIDSSRPLLSLLTGAAAGDESTPLPHQHCNIEVLRQRHASICIFARTLVGIVVASQQFLVIVERDPCRTLTTS